MKDNRPNWDSYFMKLAETVALRSNCLRNTVGVVIAKERRMIAAGYNGTPAGVKNCSDGGCVRCHSRSKNILKANERKDLCICVHAEENAILQSAYHGVSTKNAILYSTIAPCLQCAKSIINAGIKEVVYKTSYTVEDEENDMGAELLKTAGIVARKIK